MEDLVGHTVSIYTIQSPRTYLSELGELFY